MNRTTVQLCNNHKLAFTHTQNKKEKKQGKGGAEGGATLTSLSAFEVQRERRR